MFYERKTLGLNTIKKWNKINCLEKNGITGDNLRRYYQKFINNYKSVSELQKTFRSYEQNMYTEEVNKIALSNDDDKWVQSIYSTETYPIGMSDDVIRES